MKKKIVDAKDIEILNILQENSFISNQDLAKRINLSPSPTLRRVENLWKNGILSKYKASINLHKFSYHLSYLITCSVLKNLEYSIVDVLKNIKYCFSIYRSELENSPIGVSALAIVVVCKTLLEYQGVLEKIKNIDGIITINVLELKDILKENFIQLDNGDELK